MKVFENSTREVLEAEGFLYQTDSTGNNTKNQQMRLHQMKTLGITEEMVNRGKRQSISQLSGCLDTIPDAQKLKEEGIICLTAPSERCPWWTGWKSEMAWEGQKKAVPGMAARKKREGKGEQRRWGEGGGRGGKKGRWTERKREKKPEPERHILEGQNPPMQTHVLKAHVALNVSINQTTGACCTLTVSFQRCHF